MSIAIINQAQANILANQCGFEVFSVRSVPATERTEYHLELASGPERRYKMVVWMSGSRWLSRIYNDKGKELSGCEFMRADSPTDAMMMRLLKLQLHWTQKKLKSRIKQLEAAGLLGPQNPNQQANPGQGEDVHDPQFQEVQLSA